MSTGGGLQLPPEVEGVAFEFDFDEFRVIRRGQAAWEFAAEGSVKSAYSAAG